MQRDGMPALQQCTDVLASVSKHEQTLRQKAGVVEAAHAALDEARTRLQLDRDEFDRQRDFAARQNRVGLRVRT
jgi:hypothetical protein